MNNEQTALTADEIMAKNGIISFPPSRPIGSIKAAMEEFAEQKTQRVAVVGNKAFRLLMAAKGLFERWDEATHADFVKLMATEVIPFISSEEAQELAH